MDQAEYQRRRRQLDAELRAGIEMLQEGHRAKVEALDSLWLEADEEAPASPPTPPEPSTPEPIAPEPAPLVPPTPREQREAGELREDVEAALAAMGEEFDKRDLCRALGYDPNRTSLHRVLWNLQGEGLIEVLRHGVGGRATRYRKGSPGSAG
ncbi:MAG TPA: hypothetical protein VFR03_08460 [Thermoanaerobaculia bacterium]|nr:hypothetical protein [Thermoanaerobaculia bacterium]